MDNMRMSRTSLSVQLSQPVCLCACFPLHNSATLHAAQVRYLTLMTCLTLLGVPMSIVAAAEGCLSGDMNDIIDRILLLVGLSAASKEELSTGWQSPS